MVADGYKETEIGVIPIEWDVVSLNNVAYFFNGYPFKSTRYNDLGNYNIVTIRNVKNGFLDLNDINKISILPENLSDYQRLQINDILISMTGNVGRVCKVSHHNCLLNQRVGKIIIKNQNNNFIYQILITNDFISRMIFNAQGGAQPNLSKNDILNYEFPLPPLKEQEKIADILSTADDKIDAVSSQIQKAEILKQGLQQKLLSEGMGHSEFKDSELGKMPESWDVVELEKLLTFKNGVNASKEQYGKGYKFINVLDIINNLTIRHDDIIGRVDIEENEFELYEVKYGDILFQRSSETKEEVGQSNVYLDKEQSATFGGFVIKGSAKQEYNPVFMNYLFKVPAIRKQITSKSGGSTRYNIGQNSLNQVVVQFPPLEEQKQIADILSTADEKLEVLKAKKEKYETLKKGLLQKLLSGEVRVDV